MTDYFKDYALRLFDRGYPVLPIIPGKKSPAIDDWRAIKIDRAQVEAWVKRYPGHGVGVRTEHVVLLDVDVRDRAMALRIKAKIEERWNWPPIRVGARPKFGVPLYTVSPLPHMQTREYADRQGNKSQAELIATTQFVAFADHPDTGEPYRWLKGDSILDHDANELEPVTAEQLRDFFAECEEMFAAASYQTKGRRTRPATALADRDDWSGERVQDVSAERFGEMVRAIVNDDWGYEDWFAFLAAIKHQLGEDGGALAEEWSATSGKHQKAKFDKTWASIGNYDSAPVTGRLILKLYKEHRTTSRPIIRLEAGELYNAVVQESERALLASGQPLYCRGVDIVRPIREALPTHEEGVTTRTPRLHSVAEYDLLSRFGEEATYMGFSVMQAKIVRKDPPKEIAKVYLARVGDSRLPPIVGISNTPILRRDGTAWTQPGYDAATGMLLFSPPAMPPIPDKPMRDHALAALELLDDLLNEFPFVDGASRAVALSAMLTPLTRSIVRVAPLFAFAAPSPGSGKSYLTHLFAALAIGDRCPVIAHGADKEELEKRLGSMMMAGHPVFSIDNVNGTLEGDALCQAVEQPRPFVRILGSSQTREIDCRSTFFATGNNIKIMGDLVRRTLRCTLDARTETPEERKFENDPLKILLAERGKYLAAAFTIIRAYVAAGTPQRLKLPSYDDWSLYVRSPLIWLGCHDPVATIATTRMEDPEASMLRGFVGAWRDAVKENAKMSATELRDELPDDALPYTSTAGIGQFLDRYKGRIVDGVMICGAYDKKKHANRWWWALPL